MLKEITAVREGGRQLKVEPKERRKRTGGAGGEEVPRERPEQVKGRRDHPQKTDGRHGWKMEEGGGGGLHREIPFSLEGYIFPEMLCQHGGASAATSASD